MLRHYRLMVPSEQSELCQKAFTGDAGISDTAVSSVLL